MNNIERDSSGVRNSDLRKATGVFDPGIDFVREHVPGAKKVTATQISVVGFLLAGAGIEVQEYQNRTGKRSKKLTALSICLTLAGVFCDVLDGKVARKVRNEMIDPAKREEDEKLGQAIDPMVDGGIEGWRATSSAVTAFLRGDYFGVQAAIFNLRTTNLPRTGKAIAGSVGVSTPETYSRLDPRNIGTSLGRKAPNYLATYVPTIGKIPVQGICDTIVGLASMVVAGERVIASFRPSGPKLSAKETEHAMVRAEFLAGETVVLNSLADITQKSLK